jgi:putative RecB family exonuclease
MGRALPSSLSPSSISSFKECPLAFRFSYLDRLPEPPSPWASKGSLVHRALELLMCRPAPERTIDAALADLDQARVELADHPEFAELELSDDEWELFHLDAQELVRRYFTLEDPTTVHPIGLELKLQAEVGAVRVRGIIDRLEIDDEGELVVTDYKTGRVPSQLLYLSKPEAIIATPTEQSCRGMQRKTAALWSAIERACARDDFRPHPSRLCDFCSFKTYCPAYGGDPEQAEELRGPGTVIAPALPLAGV